MAEKRASWEMPIEASEEEASFLLESEDAERDETDTRHWAKQRTQRVMLMFTLLLAANMALLLVLIWLVLVQVKPVFHRVYSPLDHVVKYKNMVFLDNIYEVSPFQGPPDDVKDELWDKLYRNTSVTVIDAESAKRLPNRTMVVPGTDGDGIVQFEVFHQLHCLNALRKSLYLERFPNYSVFFSNGTRNPDISIHHDHCIDRIRQATMCAGDLGASYWRWNQGAKQWMMNMRTTHTCRNFEDIRQWTVARNLAEWDDTMPSRLTG